MPGYDIEIVLSRLRTEEMRIFCTVAYRRKSIIKELILYRLSDIVL